MKKNQLIKNWPVQFQFYKPETEKTELNQTEPKPEKNRAEPRKIEKTEPNRFLF
jgi:hypothetical protein